MAALAGPSQERRGFIKTELGDSTARAGGAAFDHAAGRGCEEGGEEVAL